MKSRSPKKKRTEICALSMYDNGGDNNDDDNDDDIDNKDYHAHN